MPYNEQTLSQNPIYSIVALIQSAFKSVVCKSLIDHLRRFEKWDWMTLKSEFNTKQIEFNPCNDKWPAVTAFNTVYWQKKHSYIGISVNYGLNQLNYGI